MNYERIRVNHLNLFWIGFVSYSVAYAISCTPNPNFVLCNIFQVIGLILFWFASSRLYDVSGKKNRYLSSLTFAYLGWTTFVIYRGFSADYEVIKVLLFDPYLGLFLYLAPIFVFFNIDEIHIKKAFDVIIVTGIIYIILSAYFINYIVNTGVENLSGLGIVEMFAKTLGIPCGFLVLTFPYHNNKKIFFAICVLLVSLLFAILKARRGLTFMVVIILALAYALYLYKNIKNLNSILLFVYILFGVGVFVLYNLYDTQLGIFRSITNRMEDDSRSPVEYCFYNDMSPTDWIIGKGFAGKYFCPAVDAPDAIYRQMIETDYLNVILKGGVVSLTLLLLIVLPAMYMGLFKSKNFLAKGCAVWIGLWVVFMYPANVTTFNLHYLLVWLAVALCYSGRLRNLSENEMRTYLS